MATLTAKIQIEWGHELVGDEKDSSKFYERFYPVVRKQVTKLNEADLAKLAQETCRVLQRKLKDKKIG